MTRCQSIHAGRWPPAWRRASRSTRCSATRAAVIRWPRSAAPPPRSRPATTPTTAAAARARGRLRAGRRRPRRGPAPPYPRPAAWQAAAAAAAVWAVTGARSLHHEAERARLSLTATILPRPGTCCPSLCSRDPAELDAKEIARAVIESVAENTSDAVVAPLLWGAVAGMPGLVAYRAVNTLDAMVGYRSARYLRFGWASARLDDVANWVPARVTAALAAACAPLVREASPVRSCGSCSATAATIRARTRAAARPPSRRRSASASAGRTSTAAWPRRARSLGDGTRPGARGHPPRRLAVQGGHGVRDRPGRAGGAVS